MSTFKKVPWVRLLKFAVVAFLFGALLWGTRNGWESYVNYIIAFGGTLFGWLQVYNGDAAQRAKREWSQNLVRFGWDDIAVASIAVLEQAELEYQPDAILCLSEVSGMVVSIAGSEIRRDIPFFFACWQKDKVSEDQNRRLVKGFYAIAVTNGVVYIPKALDDYTDRKILVIDERCRSGGTIQKIAAILSKRGFSKVEFATLWVCKGASTEGRIGPRFWHFETPDEVIYTPWGKLE